MRKWCFGNVVFTCGCMYFPPEAQIQLEQPCCMFNKTKANKLNLKCSITLFHLFIFYFEITCMFAAISARTLQCLRLHILRKSCRFLYQICQSWSHRWVMFENESEFILNIWRQCQPHMKMLRELQKAIWRTLLCHHRLHAHTHTHPQTHTHTWESLWGH